MKRYKKMERHLELLRLGLPTSETMFFTSDRLPQIMEATAQMLRMLPSVCIRTDTGGACACPLLDVTSIGDGRKITAMVSGLPKDSLVILNSVYSEGAHCGILVATKQGDAVLEVVSAKRYRQLSRGRGTPEVSYVKRPGNFFAKLVNRENGTAYTMPSNTNVVLRVLAEIRDGSYMDIFFGAIGPNETALSFEFDWHRDSGMRFADLERH